MRLIFTGRWMVLAVLLMGVVLRSSAQPMIPANFSIVTVQATAPLATEPGNNPAVFSFSRIGGTNSALTVTFKIGGTATNGVDYEAISNSFVLAAGQTSANVVITPISQWPATGYKTVVLTLPRKRGAEPVGAGSYEVGSLDRAIAYIAYNYTNIPPTVSIVTPTNDTSYLSKPNIEIAANAYDSNGWVTSVQFLASGASLGVVSNGSFAEFPPGLLVMRKSHGSVIPVWQGNRVNRYQFVWTNVASGSYSLTAIATDNAGLQTTSAPVSIVVTTNMPTPIVRIVSPANGSDFPDLAPINIYAAAAEQGGVIKTVKFLANSNSLGFATNYLAAEPFSQFHLKVQWLPYSFRWTNALVGTNYLTVIATDNNGTQATSDPVAITVTTNVLHLPHPIPLPGRNTPQ